METSRKSPEQVAANFWFVCSAYALVIGAWYAVSINVFITSRWRTVAETRKRGQRHLLVLSLGMSYLAVYVYFQAKSGDYNEVCLELAAFAVVVLHTLRTVLGLWQLHIYRHWVIRSIRCMESLGYQIESAGADSGRNTRRGRSSTAAQEQRRDQERFDADSIIVNDTIVGNRLSEGDVQCELQFFTLKQKQNIICEDNFLMRAPLTLFYTLKSTASLCGIVRPLLLSRSPLHSEPDSTPFLRPREADIWLRWVTVLISCAFPNWLTDMRKSHSEESISQRSVYQVYRDRFAEDVLRCAALQCERGTLKKSSGSFLPIHLWSKFPKLSRGKFCQQEFLRYACTTGNGLPFQEPHKHAASRMEEDLVYSYSKYRSKLEEARDALPANEGEKLACLGTEELEWLSMFLSVEDWSNGTIEKDNADESLSSVQPPRSNSTDIAIENLGNQLGFSGNVKSFSERLAAPFLKGKERVTLWGNRNVLTLSGHVDNWLALLAGEQMVHMTQQEEEFLSRNLKAKYSVNRTQERIEFSHIEQSLTFLGCSMENLRSSMTKWEESNPEEQSSSWAPTLGSSEVSADAMNGGKFVFHASKDFESCLSQVSSVSCWSQRYLQMRLLWELQNNLHNSLPECGLAPDQTGAILLCILSFPAIRVIASEIEQTRESTVSVHGDQDYCYINIDEKPPTFRIEDCKLTLRASYGPQNVHIEVFFTRQVNVSGIVVTAQLCGNEFEEGKPFVWEAWRDVFYESLQSTRQWQVGHQIANSSLSIRPCIHSIGAGIRKIGTISPGIGSTMKIWKGWPPHREALSKYEMMTDGLILERKKTAVIPGKSLIAHRISTYVARPLIQYVPVSYEKAKAQYLVRASQIAQVFLHKAVSCSVDENVGESAKGHMHLELQRYEVLATQAEDDIALDKAMNMLISGNPNCEAIERAVELLEGYFTSEAAKVPSVRILASLSRPVRKQNWLWKIKRHYEELMTATRFDPITAISFAGFCSAVPSHCREVLNEDGIRALAIAIVRTTCSRNTLLAFELTKNLERLIGTENEGWYYLACSMNFNKIEYATRILSSARNGAALTCMQSLRRGFMSFFRTCKCLCGKDSILLLSDFESELDKSKANAQNRLGQLFKRETYGVGAYASRAVQLYSQAADDGDLVSAYHLGLLLENGVGDGNCVPQDMSRAMELYRRARKGGIESAIIPLAGIFADDSHSRKNAPYAANLYARAIEKTGDISAMHGLACLLQRGAEGVPRDLPRAVQLYSRAVDEGGDVDSMHLLASLLATGAKGVPKDAPSAVRLYESAIKERGEPRAKNNLGRLFETGPHGVPVSLNRAFALYQSSIEESDNTNAMVKLGLLYLKGKGVSVDAVRATQLFQRAIDKDGNESALVRLADVLIEGAVGVPQDPIRAVELYIRAIEEHGSGNAMFELASVLEFGKKGVPADSARAFSLYNRAASEKKHRAAARRLKKVEKQKQVLDQVKHIWHK